MAEYAGSAGPGLVKDVDESSLRADNAQLRARIASMEASTTWGLSRAFARVARSAAPSGTIRRALIRRMVGVLRTAVAEIAVRRSVPQPEDVVLGGHESPLVSIVIPVHNKIAYTMRCLDSVAKQTSLPYEVIVVDDASTDATEDVLRRVPGLRLVVNDANEGFLRSTNKGAAEAEGDYIVFLNNDTEVREGWLDVLVETADADEMIGIVGAKLVYPDGRLQEAGGIIWRDGAGWNFGRLDRPGRSRYNYLRDVDYCSGACLLVRRALFESLGGFDERYAPAYYEDTDLAFAARDIGYRVVYQPLAQVVHHEGVTSGTDLGSGAKRFQAVNQAAFCEKWGDVLKGHPLPGDTPPGTAYDRSGRPRVLVMDHKVPTPDQDSGSVRLSHILRMLQNLGFDVAFAPDNLDLTQPYTDHLRSVGVEVLAEPEDLPQFLAAWGESLDLCVLARPNVAAHHLFAIRAQAPKACIVYDTVDLHFLREERRSSQESRDGVRRLAATYRQLELGLARACDAVITVTEPERQLLLSMDPDLSVFVIPNVHEVAPTPELFSSRWGFLFVGGFEHPPNVDAIRFLAGEVMPAVRRDIPRAELFVVGSKPPPEVLALEAPGMTVTGWVPDIASYYGRVRVSVAPLRYGAGMKGKIGESLAFGVPVVATTIGNEGMDLVDGKEAMIADSPDAFARAMVHLHGEKGMWVSLRGNGLGYIEERLSPACVRGEIKRMLVDLGVPVGGRGDERMAE